MTGRGDLPRFQDTRRRVFEMLGDAQDELRSDWAPGSGPTDAQADAIAAAHRAIQQRRKHSTGQAGNAAQGGTALEWADRFSACPAAGERRLEDRS